LSSPPESNVRDIGSSALELLVEDKMLIIFKVLKTLLAKLDIRMIMRMSDIIPPRIVRYSG
jgi:hypothetical protein